MKTLALALSMCLLALTSGVASAQQGRRHEGKQQMRQEDRQRMRDDMNQVGRDRGRDAGARPERQARPMSPEQRDKLRRDIQDANKQIKR